MKNPAKFSLLFCCAVLTAQLVLPAPGISEEVTFPEGTATSSESCGKCHQAIYREYAFGFGSDTVAVPTTLPGRPDQKLVMPSSVSATATAHAIAGVDPYPIHARDAEESGRACNVCHFPQPFDLPHLGVSELIKPYGRDAKLQGGGLTCASCHLTRDNKIRGPHGVNAPHATVEEPAVRTAAMCAYCHSLGKRVVGKQTQTFLEWREDFMAPGLGSQHCQDCHMPRTMRKTAEQYDVPLRPVARHLWTGGRSHQRLASALSLSITQEGAGGSRLGFHVINIGAGHSVPTGSNRRAIYLKVEVQNRKGKTVQRKEWMFAPWYGNRPDDRKYLEEDKTRPDAVAAMQADAQGPHEEIIRAGEERVLPWEPALKPGEYTVKARLIYDLNRYNSRAFKEDQTEINSTQLPLKVKKSS
ncbi:hypothetical protein GMSM_29270 [Geomonas sp. Red276]